MGARQREASQVQDAFTMVPPKKRAAQAHARPPVLKLQPERLNPDLPTHGMLLIHDDHTHIYIYKYFLNICERIRICICIFYMYKNMYIFRDLESGLSKTKSVWT